MLGLFGITPPLFFGASPIGSVGFEDMTKTQEARYADHEVHLGLPISEFLGPQLAEVEFTMNFINGITLNPEAAIIIVETAMALSIPAPLIIGSKPMGRGTSLFSVRSITEKPKFFYNDGTIIAATIGVKLKEYVAFPALHYLSYF